MGNCSSKNEFPYIDIFTDEIEARKEVGTSDNSLLISGVKTGFCIVEADGSPCDESNDFYETEEEANIHKQQIESQRKHEPTLCSVCDASTQNNEPFCSDSCRWESDGMDEDAIEGA